MSARKLLVGLALSLGIAGGFTAWAQAPVTLCFPNGVNTLGGVNCAPVTAANPLPTSATLSASSIKILDGAGGVNTANVSAGGALSVDIGAVGTLHVDGTGTAGAAAGGVLTVQGVASMTPILVNGSGVTQPVSGTVTANLGTIAGVATAVKQPALGTAGVSSTDVISVQGIASGTALPVSGTVTANLGTIAGVSTAAKQPALGTAGASSTDVISVQGIASGTALPVSGTITANIGTAGTLALDASVTGLSLAQGATTAGAKGLMTMGSVTTGAPAYTNGQISPLSITTGGKVRMDADLTSLGGTGVAVNNGSSSTGTLRVTIASDSTGIIAPVARTSGGTTPSHTLSAASTNGTVVKASAGQVFMIAAVNTTATLYYLKFYDKATTPTCNSDTVVMTYPVPASATGAGIVVPVTLGIVFSTGIGFCLTGGIADNDNTNAATGVAINVMYK